MKGIYSLIMAYYEYFDYYFQCSFIKFWSDSAIFFLHYGYIRDILTVVKACPETQFDYSVSMYLFRKCPISYTMSTRARKGQSLEMKKKC